MKTQSLILSLLLLCSVALVQGQTIFRQTFDADIPFNGVAGRCDVVVRFVTGTAFTTAPIIVVEGFDPGHILEPENPDGQQGLADFLTSLEPVELDNRIRTSDVVYINWRNGTDFIQRNAFALERAIRWVNEEKRADGINLPNILIGQSMGGVVARYALRDMENRNLDHNVELYVSHDAPHLGANVPQGFQHFARHGKDLYVRTGLTAGLVEAVQLFRNRMSPRAALTLADQPASRQMLYNYVNANNTIDNTTHNAWQTELNTLGFPAGDGTTPFRQIAISNGAECSATQTFGDGDNLFTFRGRANTRFLGDLAATSVLPIAAHYLGQPGLFFLGIYPGRNDFEVDFSVNAQADGQSNQVYHGSIVYKKKVLWVVPVQTTLTSRTFTSSSTTLPLDHAPGGWYAVPVNLNDAQVQNDFLRYNITANNADRFNFIPTPSALAIGAGVTTPVKADYFVPYPGSNPPPAPRNSPFVNYVTAFDATNVNLNEEHITLEPRSGNWLLAELNGNNGVLANCQFSCNTMTTSIVGPSAMCNTQQYSISNLPPGAVVDWLVSPENIVNPAVNNNILTLTRVNNGFIDISAVVRTNCVATDPIAKNNVKVGFPPFVGSMTGPSSVYQNASYYYSVNLPLNVTGSKTWIVPAGWAVTAGQGTIQATIRTGTNGGTVTCRITECGITRDLFKNVTTDGGGTPLRTDAATLDSMGFMNIQNTRSSIRVWPNPAYREILVTYHAKETQTGNSIKHIRITDVTGGIRKEFRYSDLYIQRKLHLDGLTKGIYFISVLTTEGWFNEKILVQ